MLADTPVKSGYVEAQAGWRLEAGPYARLEAGARLTPRAALFGFGELSRDSMAGVGYRWEFDF